VDHCLACDKDVAATVVMNGAAQLVKQCPECDNPLGQALTAPMAAYDKSTERAMPVAKVLPLPVKTRPVEQPVTDVIGLVQSRRAYLVGEMAKLAGYKAELAMLDRMLGKRRRRRTKKS
jgi:hypothetical protein